MKKGKQQRRYHTDVVLAYRLGLLSKEYTQQIPSSTLSNWKQREMTGIHGLPEDDWLSTDLSIVKMCFQLKRTREVLRAIFCITMVLSEIVQQSHQFKNLLKANRQKIVDCISMVRPVLGLRRTSAVLGITVNQYYSWRSQKSCPLPLYSLCRKKHPAQLSEPEAAVIQKYCSSSEYERWPLSSIYYKVLSDGAGFFSMQTFYRYARRLGLSTNRKRGRKPTYEPSIRASGPLQIIHADVTVLRLIDKTKL